MILRKLKELYIVWEVQVNLLRLWTFVGIGAMLASYYGNFLGDMDAHGKKKKFQVKRG